jgi:N-acetylneuraminic acid mutarotase
MDLHSKQWTRIIAGIDSKQDEPTPCVHARCAAINSMVYSFGGWYMTDEGNEARLNKVFALDSNKMRWKKLEKKGNKPAARNSCGLCAVGEKLVLFGGLISHADGSKIPDGAQYKQDNASFGYINDCWEFCPRKGKNGETQHMVQNVLLLGSHSGNNF